MSSKKTAPANRRSRARAFLPAPFTLRGDLLPHQEHAVNWLLDNPRALLAHDTGLGKTVEAMAYIAALESSGELLRVGRTSRPQCRVLWVTEGSASLQEQTRRAFERFMPDHTAHVGIPSGSKEQRAWRDRYGTNGCPDILIVGYEMLHSRSHWLTTPPALLVLDEVGHLRGGGKHWATVQGVAKDASRVVGMTASWVQNSPADPWHLLAAIGTSNLWPLSEFESRFCTMRRTHTDMWGRDHFAPDFWVDDAALRGEVRGYLTEHMHYVDVEAAGLSLPSHVGDKYRWVTLAKDEQKAYDAAANRTGLHGHQAREAAAKTAGVDSALIAALLCELDSRSGEQAVVYCETLAMLDLAAQRMAGTGITFARIEGQTQKAERVEAVDDFRNGDVQVLLGSKVLEHGLDLQHCRVLISVDSSWNPERERQREGRIRRIGSPHQTFEHLTLLPDTPHTRKKLATVDKKRRLAEAIRPEAAFMG